MEGVPRALTLRRSEFHQAPDLQDEVGGYTHVWASAPCTGRVASRTFFRPSRMHRAVSSIEKLFQIPSAVIYGTPCLPGCSEKWDAPVPARTEASASCVGCGTPARHYNPHTPPRTTSNTTRQANKAESRPR
ncbi:hypothetical protein SVIO_040050 [Streptomyces violaceusniger]|uniref:Uncharacterized protein n=1 Tax=Streptomyces violaceusniger TaxID=68280 RepID=A0A4D4KX58_STRVO|nr:hypothetical protein SVIO_040050 [Streptomyces violaceusniger]